MIEFFRKLFGPAGSSSTAKERLRLVLMSDHLSLAPDMVEAMKRDFIDVIAKYVEVDRDKIEINFEQQDKALAMLANVPILAVNRYNGEPTSSPPSSTPPTAGGTTTLPRRKRRRKNTGTTVKTETAPAT
jgi:cell division topological specificity factor